MQDVPGASLQADQGRRVRRLSADRRHAPAHRRAPPCEGEGEDEQGTDEGNHEAVPPPRRLTP